MHPFEENLERPDTIPGVGRRTRKQILAETGMDMNRFPSAAHLCPWAGLAPGNHESAGKRRSGKTTEGSQKLRSCLVEAARSASRRKNTYLSGIYQRIAARRGATHAAVVVSHRILTIVYHLWKEKKCHELGPNYYEARRCTQVTKQAIRKLESLGFKVTIEAMDQIA